MLPMRHVSVDNMKRERDREVVSSNKTSKRLSHLHEFGFRHTIFNILERNFIRMKVVRAITCFVPTQELSLAAEHLILRSPSESDLPLLVAADICDGVLLEQLVVVLPSQSHFPAGVFLTIFFIISYELMVCL